MSLPTKEQFEEMIRQDAFLEYDAHMANFYGTPEAQVDEKLEHWAADAQGLLLKTERDRYLFIVEDLYYDHYVEGKFSVLGRDVRTGFQPAGEGGRAGVAQEDLPLLRSFAHDEQGVRSGAYVVHIEAERLGDSQA